MNQFLPFRLLSVFLLFVSPCLAANQVTIADDDANQGMYNGGWSDGSGNDNGFFAWKMVQTAETDGSFAGHYLANRGEHGRVEILTSDRAFALFANGRGFEESVAFRGISVPLEPGDNLSFDLLIGPFQQKFEEDAAAPSEVGVAYRAGNANVSVGDAKSGARLVFFAREDSPNYLISDSQQEFDTGIPIDWDAVSLTVTMVNADTYDLEVINLRDQSKKLFEQRKFGGEAGKPIESLAFFNRNAETNDFFFNNFQLSRNAP